MPSLKSRLPTLVPLLRIMMEEDVIAVQKQAVQVSDEINWNFRRCRQYPPLKVLLSCMDHNIISPQRGSAHWSSSTASQQSTRRQQLHLRRRGGEPLTKISSRLMALPRCWRRQPSPRAGMRLCLKIPARLQLLLQLPSICSPKGPLSSSLWINAGETIIM